MKICHLSPGHPISSTRIYYKECFSLFNAGYEVCLIALESQTCVPNGVEVISIPKPTHRWERFFLTTYAVYRIALQQRADYYHFHDPEFLPFALLLKLLGKKVIYDIHEDLPRLLLFRAWIPSSVLKLLCWAVEKFENFAARHFDALVCATDTIAKRFSALHKKVVVVRNYPVLANFDLHVVHQHFSGKNFCYIGGISQARGTYEMVLAAASAEVELLLAGPFEHEKLFSQTQQMPEWKRVEYLGVLNKEEVRKVLARSLAGLVLFLPAPNHINAIPNKMFEYMAAGLPIIASHFPLWNEIIQKYQCGISVNPHDVHEIAQAMKWVVEHPTEAKRMGENGREAVAKHCNWENESKALLTLYEGLL